MLAHGGQFGLGWFDKFNAVWSRVLACLGWTPLVAAAMEVRTLDGLAICMLGPVLSPPLFSSAASPDLGRYHSVDRLLPS